MRMSEGRCRQQWRHTSAVLAMLVNVNSDPKKGSPAKPSDFDPYEQADREGEEGGEVIRVKVSSLKGMFDKNPGQVLSPEGQVEEKG